MVGLVKTSTRARALVLLSAQGNIRRALDLATRTGAVVVALDDESARAADTRGLSWRHAGDYAARAEGDVWSAAERISRAWYVVDDRDPTRQADVSLGELFFFEFGERIVAPLVRRTFVLRAIIEAERPNRVLVATGHGPFSAHACRELLGPSAHVSELRTPLRASFREATDKRRLLSAARSFGLDRMLKVWAFALSRLRGARDHRTHAPGCVLVVADIPTPSVIDTLAPVAHALGNHGAMNVATDPRCSRMLAERGLSSVSFFRFDRGRHTPRDFGTVWEEIAHARDASRTLVVDDVDLWPGLRRECRRLVRRRFPLAVRDLEVVEELLESVRPAAILTAADAHYFGQLFVTVGRRLGIRSICVQHGAFGHTFGYLPVRANQLAVWGPAVRDWCIANGASAERVAIAGQPRFDLLRARAANVNVPSARTVAGLDRTRPTLLFAPEPLTMCPDLCHWMVREFAAAVAAMPEWQVLVRPHPSDSPARLGRLFTGDRALRDRIRIFRHSCTAEALMAADIIVIGQSTLGLEAMILGRPVVTLMPLGADSGVVPYAREGAAVGCTDRDTLRAAVATLTAPGPMRERLQEGVRAFLHNFHAGGESAARRVAELLTNTESGPTDGVAA